MKVDNIALMMFVLNFVEFCFIFELIYSSDFHEGRQYFMLMQSSRQRHYFLDSICSALITRELRGPKMAGCSILEFSFVSSERGA